MFYRLFWILPVFTILGFCWEFYGAEDATIVRDKNSFVLDVNQERYQKIDSNTITIENYYFKALPLDKITGDDDLEVSVNRVKNYFSNNEKLNELLVLADKKVGIQVIPVLEEIAFIAYESQTENLVIDFFDYYVHSENRDVNRIARGIQMDLLDLNEWNKLNTFDLYYRDVESEALNFMEKPLPKFIGHPDKLLPLNYLELELFDHVDVENRLEAVKQLSLQRSDEISKLLLIASRDSDDRVRLIAIEALMHAALIGFDVNGRAIDEFRYATNDPNEEISNIAISAVGQLSAIQQ